MNAPTEGGFLTRFELCTNAMESPYGVSGRDKGVNQRAGTEGRERAEGVSESDPGTVSG